MALRDSLDERSRRLTAAAESIAIGRGGITAVSEATGLVLPDVELRDAARRASEDIDRQVQESSEVEDVVRALERQYDAFNVTDRKSLLSDNDGKMPTADELAAEFERFLADQDGPPPSP